MFWKNENSAYTCRYTVTKMFVCSLTSLFLHRQNVPASLQTSVLYASTKQSGGGAWNQETHPMRTMFITPPP